MVSDCLARNLSALAASNADVAETIRNMAPQTPFRIERSVAGWPVPLDESKGGKPTASLDDPLEEYRNQVRQSAPNGICAPVLLGSGAGYLFLAVCLELGDRISSILVIEPDLALFQAVLSVLDLSKVLGNPELRVVLGRDLKKVETHVLSSLPHLIGAHPLALKDPIAWERHGSYLALAEQTLNRLIERGKAEARLCCEWGTQIEENIWRNARWVLTGPLLSDIANSFADTPVVLVSGGPSLAQDLPDLAELRPLPLMVAVDTCYPVLQRAGIEPHIVVSCDPTPLNQRHFDASTPQAETLLAFDPEVYFRIPERWPGPRVALNAGESPTCAWLRELRGDLVSIRKPISVVHAALELVFLLGRDPVILLGCDFAYDRKGGETHVTGTVLGREHGAVEAAQEAIDLHSRDNAETNIHEPLVWLPGKQGGQVPASQTLALFAAEFERRLADSQATIIDAGSGGARLNGTISKPLSQMRNLLVSSSPDRRALLEVFTSQSCRKAPDWKTLREETLDVLDRAVRNANEGLNLCERDRRDSESLADMEKIFWTIQRDPTIRRVFGLALYATTFALVQRTDSDSPSNRAHKFHAFFKAILTAQAQIRQAMDHSFSGS